MVDVLAQCLIHGDSFAADGEARTVIDQYQETPIGGCPEAGEALVEHAIAVADDLSCGQIKINGVRMRNRLMVPLGGMRCSGYGPELGAAGIEEFTKTSAVMA